MLHAENQDRLYLIAPSDEQQALIDGLAFNVQGLGKALQRLAHRRGHPCSCWSRSSMRDAIASGLIL